MKLIMNGYSEFFQVAERTARKYFRFYQNLFTPYQDVNDIIQESHLTVFQTINKYNEKPKEEIFKLCNQAVGWRLKKLVKYARSNFNEDEEENISDLYYNDEMLLSDLQKLTLENKFNFEELIGILSEREYKIIKMIFLEKRTHADIALLQGCSRQKINFVYHRALTKSRRYLEITSNE